MLFRSRLNFRLFPDLFIIRFLLLKTVFFIQNLVNTFILWSEIYIENCCFGTCFVLQVLIKFGKSLNNLFIVFNLMDYFVHDTVESL